MTQLWREIYYRISLAGGMIAMLLMTTGFSGHMAMPRFSELFRPKKIFPAPVMMSCEENLKVQPPLKVENPSWCQVAVDHRGLDKKKTENIF